MLKSMASKLSSNSMRSSKPLAPEDKPIAGMATRTRRALGDITNANGDTTARDLTLKRPITIISSEIAQESKSSRDSALIDVIEEQDEERNYMKRDADDIDARDAENPLLCTEYVNEMYDNFMELEREFMVDPQYMVTMQPYVNEKMRAILVDWLVMSTTYVL
jgi:hypothetical protein